MVKTKLLVLTFLAFSLRPCWAESTAPVPAAAGAEDKKSVTLQQALALEHASKYLEAREAYQALLQSSEISKQKSRKILKKVEQLNIKILFSPLAMEKSIFHEVVPGDGLFKLAQKYHTTMELIKKSNHLQSDIIKTGTKLKIFTGVFSIKVDKSQNVLTLYMNHKPFKHYRVATGTQSVTPVGEFRIINRVENPTWYKTGAVIPAGDPKNALGTRWLGLDMPGYGIHGTIEPKSIGHQTTSGCVRLLNEDVEELYTMVPQGTVVRITE